MATESARDLVGALEDILETERAALLKGDVDAMTRLAENKERLIDLLNARTDLPHTELIRLHDKISRNQSLMNSALEGIRAVAARMSEMRQVRQALHTYDRSGSIRKIINDAARQIEKRA